ncbi:hypothetical protein ACTWQB_16530 [Piscibacillus sp. B03]|uniref:hypothetical protein n=1 Tax=Piscibacillus sp. B03 TaxID=3457430 RepID=UPI003FCDFC9C
MKNLLKIHTEWAKKSRQEFKESKHYHSYIGENFFVRENGDVWVHDIGYFRQAVTPIHDYEDYKKAVSSKAI